MKVLAAFRFGITCPYSSQQPFHLQARWSFTAAIERLSRAVKEINCCSLLTSNISQHTYSGCCWEVCLYQWHTVPPVCLGLYQHCLINMLSRQEVNMRVVSIFDMSAYETNLWNWHDEFYSLNLTVNGK